jgi:Glyoxalase-like domain
MTDRPWIRPNGVVLDSPDAQRLAAFWEQLTGWPRRSNEPDWVTLVAPDDGIGLSFQTDEKHVRPIWPAAPGDPHMQIHLDVEVQDLAAAVEFATSLGAQVAEFQPQESVRVMLDPAGHPFCLWVSES